MSIRAHTTAQRLNDRVNIEHALRNHNGDVYDWETVATNVHAAVDGAKASGPEQFTADGVRSVGGYTVWMRAELWQRLSLNISDYRIVWQGRYLDIKDAPDQGLHGRMIALLCQTGVNPGS